MKILIIIIVAGIGSIFESIYLYSQIDISISNNEYVNDEIKENKKEIIKKSFLQNKKIFFITSFLKFITFTFFFDINHKIICFLIYLLFGGIDDDE